MYFMNDWDIDNMVAHCQHRAPQALPYAKFLAAWRDVVDSNSDGWAHWSGGPKAARLLMQELESIKRGAPVDVARLRKGLSPIKATATRHRLPCPAL